MPVPNLGPSADLAVRLAYLEDQLRRLQQAPYGAAFSSTQSDGSVGLQIAQDPQTGAQALTFYQGPNTGRDPNTGLHPVFHYEGQLVAGGVIEDAGSLYYRPDGSESAVTGNRGHQVFDTKGHQVFGTDEYGSSPSGVGLNSPWVGYGQPASLASGQWPSTSSTSLTGVSLLAFPAQHARVTWYGTAYCPSGAAGQVQVGINNGAAGATHSVGAGFTNITETISLSGGAWSWQEMLQLTGSAALTSGTGPIAFQIFGVWGCGSGLA